MTEGTDNKRNQHDDISEAVGLFLSELYSFIIVYICLFTWRFLFLHYLQSKNVSISFSVPLKGSTITGMSGVWRDLSVMRPRPVSDVLLIEQASAVIVLLGFAAFFVTLCHFQEPIYLF